MRRALRIAGYTGLALAAATTAAWAWQGYDLVGLMALLSAMGLC